MNALIVVWSYTLCVINIVSGLMIIQHAICNLSRWTYSIRSVALWGNALLLGGGLRVLLAFGAQENPGFGEVLINAGVALLGARGMRRAYSEFANDPNGLWSHLKAAVRIILMRVKALFAKDVK